MQIPDHLHPHVGQVLGCELDAALRRGYWAVLYGLKPFPDGDQWCVLLGDDLTTGIAGFGDTPEKAITDFEEKMRTAKAQVATWEDAWERAEVMPPAYEERPTDGIRFPGWFSKGLMWFMIGVAGLGVLGLFVGMAWLALKIGTSWNVYADQDGLVDLEPIPVDHAS